MGVGHLEKGFEEDIVTLSMDVLPVLVVWLEDVVDVDMLESEDECRDFMDVRRKGREGRRYVGNTAGGSDGLRNSRDMVARQGEVRLERGTLVIRGLALKILVSRQIVTS